MKTFLTFLGRQVSRAFRVRGGRQIRTTMRTLMVIRTGLATMNTSVEMSELFETSKARNLRALARLKKIDSEMDVALASSQTSIETMKEPDALHHRYLQKKDHELSTNLNNHVPPTFFNTKSVKIIEIKQLMKDNIVFIHEKTKDCQKLDGEILEKVMENARFCREVNGSVALEGARLDVLEKKKEARLFDVAKICGENNTFTRDVVLAWVHIHDARGNQNA